MRVARIQVNGSAPVAAIERGGALHPLAHDVDALIAGAGPGGTFDPVAGAERLAPVAPGKIVAIGLNYLDHIRESGLEPPERPLVFAKFPTSVIGAERPIRLPLELTERVDWEVELAVVIGRSARGVTPEAALDHVYGYTVANDVSARDLQFADGQWVRGKSLDTFCPLGPVMVDAADVDPEDLTLRTFVNGQEVQHGHTGRDLLFSLAYQVADVARLITLEPGDVLLTGTPANSRPVEPGDVVAVEIDGIGRLENTVQQSDRALEPVGDAPMVSGQTLHVALAIPEDEAERQVKEAVR